MNNSTTVALPTTPPPPAAISKKAKLGILVMLTFVAVIMFKVLSTGHHKSTIKILVFTNSLIINDLSLR